MASNREAFLERARRCAALTKPYIAREEGDDGNTDTAVPWSSFGADAVNNITNKVSLSLFPAAVSWTRMGPSRKVLTQLSQNVDEAEFGEIKGDLEKAFSQIEKEFVHVIEEDGDRVILHDGIEHLIVTGNYGLALNDDGKVRGIPLRRYVTRRDALGVLLEFCIKDPLDWKTLPKDVKDAALAAGMPDPTKDSTDPSGKAPSVDVFTYGVFKEGKYTVWQEVHTVKVDGSEATYSPQKLPYLFLRWRVNEDEDYGRSYVEDFEGDLQSLEGLYQMVQEGGASVARFLWMVRPGGVTSKQQLVETRNGGVITGDQNDVAALRAEKGGDLSFVMEIIERIESRLAKVFLFNSAVQRGGERVTAEEIRFVAQQLEDQLGTAYSNQVVSFQAPYARIKLRAAWKKGRVTKVPENAIDVRIITGAAALGRLADLRLLDELLLGGAQVLAAMPPYTINENAYMQRRASALGVDTAGIVLTEEERQANVEADQQAQLAQQVAPEVTKQAGQMIQNQQNAELQQENTADGN
jgi:hypothetical protein